MMYVPESPLYMFGKRHNKPKAVFRILAETDEILNTDKKEMCAPSRRTPRLAVLWAASALGWSWRKETTIRIRQ